MVNVVFMSHLEARCVVYGAMFLSHCVYFVAVFVSRCEVECVVGQVCELL